jgi:hypothetical protein
MSDADPNARCAPGTRCVNEICEGVACSGSGEVCTARVDCCGDLTCVHGVCQSSGSGDSPGNTDDNVTTLPNTGVGGEQDGHDPVLGITLAAGAASFLLRKKVRGAQTDSE